MGKPRGSKRQPVMRYWLPELMSHTVIQIEPITPLPNVPYAVMAPPAELAKALRNCNLKDVKDLNGLDN